MARFSAVAAPAVGFCGAFLKLTVCWRCLAADAALLRGHVRIAGQKANTFFAGVPLFALSIATEPLGPASNMTP